MPKSGRALRNSGAGAAVRTGLKPADAKLALTAANIPVDSPRNNVRRVNDDTFRLTASLPFYGGTERAQILRDRMSAATNIRVTNVSRSRRGYSEKISFDFQVLE